MAEMWLKDELITLRSPEPEDLELMFAMENDTLLWSIGNATLPYSRYTLRQYLEQSRQDLFTEGQARFVITLSNGENVGMIDLAAFDPLNSRAEVCIGILSKYQGRGIATHALELLCRYAMGKLHLHQLYAYTPQWHSESIKLFTKAGFTQSAVLEQWLRTEKGWENVVLMQKIEQHTQ